MVCTLNKKFSVLFSLPPTLFFSFSQKSNHMNVTDARRITKEQEPPQRTKGPKASETMGEIHPAALKTKKRGPGPHPSFHLQQRTARAQFSLSIPPPHHSTEWETRMHRFLLERDCAPESATQIKAMASGLCQHRDVQKAERKE